jgi:hypothetical protein
MLHNPFSKSAPSTVESSQFGRLVTSHVLDEGLKGTFTSRFQIVVQESPNLRIPKFIKITALHPLKETILTV